jgi:hypothetical protein
MIDPNILGALISVMVTLLTMDVMMNFYKKTYHFTVKKSCSLFRIKRNKKYLKMIFED